MSQPKPLFCVGEEVMIRWKGHPEHNVDRTEILKASYEEYLDSQTGRLNYQWGYKCASDTKANWWAEDALHKLPPKQSVDDYLSELMDTFKVIPVPA